MAGITLAQASAQLDTWLACDAAVARNQSYEIWDGDMRRRVTRADAVEIRKNIEFWDGKVRALTPASAGGRRRTRYVVTE